MSMVLPGGLNGKRRLAGFAVLGAGFWSVFLAIGPWQ
jgi:hypothetical protein